MTRAYLDEEEHIEKSYDQTSSHHPQHPQHPQCQHHSQYEPDSDCISEEEEFYMKSAPKPLYELSNENKEERPKTEYTILRVGISTLIVSNTGRIRKSQDMFSSSIGCALPGTPYRTYVVEIDKNKSEEYFVHDLVWRAFNGEPPEGWEVRHNFWEAKKGAEYYDNSLASLEIYPSTVTYMPSIRRTLPQPITNFSA